ncbi:MAG: hypothetical protein OXR62_12160 [Ahrensia sp.]|nr:hypothetical protein [Ahrensia sp.]
MAHLSRTTSVSPAIPGPLDLLRKVQLRWVKHRKRRQLVNLLDCEDRILNDMGITRGDVIESLSKRGQESQHLRLLAARRRFWARSGRRY